MGVRTSHKKVMPLPAGFPTIGRALEAPVVQRVGLADMQGAGADGVAPEDPLVPFGRDGPDPHLEVARSSLVLPDNAASGGRISSALERCPGRLPGHPSGNRPWAVELQAGA